MKLLIKAVLFSLFTLGMFTLAAKIASSDSAPSVVKMSESKIDGYKTQPAYYLVEASPKKIWNDTKGGLRTVGFILAGLSGLLVFIFGGFLPKGIGGWGSVFGVWVLSGAFIFASHSSKFASAEYTIKMCPNSYANYKGSLDSLFPSTGKDSLYYNQYCDNK